jgi:hypothetical protein
MQISEASVCRQERKTYDSERLEHGTFANKWGQTLPSPEFTVTFADVMWNERDHVGSSNHRRSHLF